MRSTHSRDEAIQDRVHRVRGPGLLREGLAMTMWSRSAKFLPRTDRPYACVIHSRPEQLRNMKIFRRPCGQPRELGGGSQLTERNDF